MNDLEMIKAYADLEGLELGPSVKGSSLLIVNRNGGYYEWYNPITDLSLTFKAMIKYDVDVIISEGLVEIDGEHVTFYQKDSLLPKAIIECVLKSRGLYK